MQPNVRVVAATILSLLATSPAAAYSISAQSLGFQDSNSLAQVESGNVLSDAFGNEIDGHALTAGDAGSLGGHMKVRIDDYFAAQNNISITFLLEKQWKSSIGEYIEHFQLDPGATELVLRVSVSGTDTSDLVLAPSQGFDNGFARSHVQAQLRYYNLNSHTAGLGQIDALGRADRNVPADWQQVFGGDSSPPGYGSASGGDASAVAELHIPASEVDDDDYLLVSGQLYGEVRGGHWNGAFAASELQGGMSFEIIGGVGAPQNPVFLSVPEPNDALLGEVAMAGVGLLAYSRRQTQVAG
jgi:hypothetical protein